jgi:dCTP diphosphatase
VTPPRLETFADVLATVERFRDDRDWRQFHSIRNLAVAIAIEASELQELFLWVSSDEEERAVLVRRRAAVEAELADIMIHCANLAVAAEIDLPSALATKIAQNEAKYPVEETRGVARKHIGRGG